MVLLICGLFAMLRDGGRSNHLVIRVILDTYVFEAGASDIFGGIFLLGLLAIKLSRCALSVCTEYSVGITPTFFVKLPDIFILLMLQDYVFYGRGLYVSNLTSLFLFFLVIRAVRQEGLFVFSFVKRSQLQ